MIRGEALFHKAGMQIFDGVAKVVLPSNDDNIES
jgi:hypothetical protein